MNAVVQALTECLGESEIIMGDKLQERATSYWNPAPTQALMLLRPRTTEEVSEILKICHAHDQSVVVQGGLTGMVEGQVATGQDVIISLERMNAIEAIDPIGGTATVQSGVVLQTFQEKLEEDDLLFPLDLGARGSCTIGGNIATNAGGINVLRYGMMRDLVLGLEAVMADGTIISSMNRMLKNNAGYDLKQLFIGTEGTLGVVTKAVVKVFPQPRSRDSAMVAMESFDQLTGFLNMLRVELASELSAFEVMWGNYFHAVTAPGWHRAPMSRDYPYYVMLETEGTQPEVDEAKFNRVMEEAFEAGLIVDAVIPKSESERRALWDIRENFEALLERPPFYLYDVSLTIPDMQTYVDRLTENLKARWPNSECIVLGHIADGNLHLFVRPGEQGDWHYDCDSIVYPLLQEFGGSVSAEHGIGIEKLDWLGYSRTEAEIALMKQLKQSLDPKGILNNGRVVRA